MAADRRKVLLIGWDAADWKVIHPLLDAGKMPGVQSLVEQGSMANLATLHPVLSPMLWTSIGTGKRPFKHGIYGFSEATPDRSGIQPITNLSRTTKALWNILTQQRRRSLVVGWWPSHPAEPIDGVMVSNNYHRAVGPLADGWPLPNGTVHPPQMASELAELRFHPDEIEASDLLPFIPRLGEIDQEKERRFVGVAKILSECTSIHGCATHLLETQDWDFAAIYYDALDHFSHLCMKFHPPRQKHIDERDFELYKDVVTAGYLYHDMMLRRLLALAGEDTTVILMSDHGFHPDHLRPAALPAEPAGPAMEHRDYGILVMRGPGIKQDHTLHGATLLDICPTVLTLMGLPVGQDMDGRPLLDAFERTPDVDSIPSWDDVEGHDGSHPPDRRLNAQESQEALEQLVALGYIDPPGPDREQALERTERELDYNLARAYMDAGRHGDAVPLLQSLYSKYPLEYRFGLQLAMCFRSLERIDELEQVVNDLHSRRHRDAELARQRLKEFIGVARTRRQQRRKAATNEAEENEPTTGGGDSQRSRQPLLTQKEWAQIQDLRGLARIDSFALDFLKGYVHLAKGDANKALECLLQAERSEVDRPGLHIQIGEAYLKLKRWSDAQRSFEKAASLDPVNAHVWLGLARSYLGRRRYRKAAAAALRTVGMMYHYPFAHYVLGVSLARIGRTDESVNALRIAATQNPNFSEAHLALARIYERRLGDSTSAKFHRERARSLRKEQKESRAGTVPIDVPEFSEDDVLSSFPPVPELDPATADNAEPIPRLLHAPVKSSQPESAESDEEIIVVSGLPRSGTSMMMQMLHAAGLPIFTDSVRSSDEDNPRGYYELDSVKRLREDAAWVSDARGRVLKVVTPLTPWLPQGFHYRVIMMQRNLAEIIASQGAMIDRNKDAAITPNDDVVKRALQRQTRQARQVMALHGIDVLNVTYADAIEKPLEVASSVCRFLSRDLDTRTMASVVDASLYRQRGSGVDPTAGEGTGTK
ncbi:Type I phosphodiesterase / nucleotide pyrophosphatase [Maioricimonas rarisocia]|uniref:Type I phosphodiesterase / nucleotide pyrophosphatase n=1 Tax=Maioricimonas rarisocia TaxID=2528026 RepID=A0A517ZB16_9PLAN|nr:alkaline phosphatase family protein [Maioricimonas rarisocia]QDU39631.1 Type I phosphodiesterase / nucleotide pyrophosphatase [Maioricimonas rarisocia]